MFTCRRSQFRAGALPEGFQQLFGTIARFEVRYQLRNPIFWVAIILFFLLTFGAVTAESIRLGSGGNIHTNAPTAIVQILVTMSMFFMFVTTAFVGNVVVRDDETGFSSIIRSTRVGKFSYLFGRFSGAFLSSAIAFLAVPLAIWIGTCMAWVDPTFLGPNRIQDYLFGYAVIALPNLLITSAIFFAVACWTRSVTYSYLAVIVFMVLYFTLTAMLKKWPDLTSIAAYIEPFSAIAFTLGTRYLSPIQANTFDLELTAPMAVNRLLWLAISAAVLAITFLRFRFAAPGASQHSAAREEARERKLRAVAPVLVNSLAAATPARAGWHMLWTLTRFEMKLVLKSPAFWVLALVGSIDLFALLDLAGRFYGIPPWPRLFMIADPVRSNSAIITLLIAVYFSGEVVWRERERRFNEIFDAAPLPNWTFLLSKLTGVVGALILLSVMFVLAESILFQLWRGLTDIGIGQWLAWFVAPGILYAIEISVLAVVVQAISPNKFVGWALMLVYVVASTVLGSMGFEHPLFHYADVTAPLSDMNGASYGGALNWWLRFYWLAVALILAVLGHLMWRRGTAVTLGGQSQTLPARLRGMPLVLLAIALACTIGIGGFLLYNMNFLSRYRTTDDINHAIAAYERRYARYIGLPQPTLTDVKLDVDIHPQDKVVRFDGTYRFVNATAVTIPTLHVRMMPGNVRFRTLVVPGAKLVHDDEQASYRIYQFDQPLQPGASGTLSFGTMVEDRGLTAVPVDQQAWEAEAQPAANGTFITNQQFAPVLGMDARGFLSGRRLRHKYGLGPDLPTPQLEDSAAQSRNYSGVNRVNTDITVTTDSDQILVATGAKVSDTVAHGRRTARFVSPSPSYDFITIQSGRYAVKTADAGGVELSVYYSPQHAWNVDRMLSVMHDALDYYRQNFGTYPFPYARIVERPGYGGGANSAPGTIGYSENVGFTMDLRDPTLPDFLSYVTAHELAHQYWFHQLMPADMQGAEVLTETLSQYSALMVMKHRNVWDQSRLMKYELDLYLQGRRQEAAEEHPLARINKQNYIHYNKGSLVMYLIQEHLGEDRVNGVLRGLLAEYGSKGAPYPRSVDLVDGLLGLARSSQERELVLDLFYRITLYDLKARNATVRQLSDGQYETTITVDAGKVYSDAKGNESPASFDGQVDVGVFAAMPGASHFAAADVLSLKRTPLHNGEQLVRVVTRLKPLYAGVDPFVTFIDRNTNDNIVRVVEASN